MRCPLSHNISQKSIVFAPPLCKHVCEIEDYYQLLQMASDPKALMKEALAEAKAGLSEGGLPIGICFFYM